MSSSLNFMMLVALLMCVGSALAGDRPNLEATIEYEWNQLNYRYASGALKAKYLQDPEFFIPENAMASGIAVYGNYIYVTIPRIKSDKGVPWVLGRIYKGNAAHDPIYPYPYWTLHTVGDCNQLQNPLAMEIDHNTGYLYVVDTGRAGLLSNNQSHSCPAKIVVYNLNSRLHTPLKTHILPDSVVNRNTSILKSIVLDYTVPHSDKVRFAYIADAGENKLIVYDFLNDQASAFSDSSMMHHDSENITINGQNFHIELGVSGLALSPDFNYLYYSSMWSDELYQVPTWPLRQRGMTDLSSFVRLVGHKVSNSDDMVHGQDSLYFGALTKDAVYRWEKRHDMLTENVAEEKVRVSTQTQLVQNWESLQWPDSLCLDERGYLWFTSSRNHLFLMDKLDFTPTAGYNFRIFKLKVDDFSYLFDKLSIGPVVG